MCSGLHDDGELDDTIQNAEPQGRAAHTSNRVVVRKMTLHTYNRLATKQHVQTERYSPLSLAPSASFFSSASVLTSAFPLLGFSEAATAGFSSAAGSGLVWAVAGVSRVWLSHVGPACDSPFEGPACCETDPGGGATAAIRAER